MKEEREETKMETEKQDNIQPRHPVYLTDGQCYFTWRDISLEIHGNTRGFVNGWLVSIHL